MNWVVFGLYCLISLGLVFSCTKRAWHNPSFKGFAEEAFIGFVFSINWFIASLLILGHWAVEKIIGLFIKEK
jgi:hypothetical protein